MDKLSEKLAVVATIDPDAYVSGVITTDWVDMDNFYDVLFIALLGTGVTTGSFNLLIQEARLANGSGSQSISGKAITTLTTGDNDSQALVHVRAADLSQGYSFVRGQSLLSGAGADFAVIAIAGRPRHHPASNFDLASVAEIID